MEYTEALSDLAACYFCGHFNIIISYGESETLKKYKKLKLDKKTDLDLLQYGRVDKQVISAELTTFFVVVMLTINCFKVYDITVMLAGG